MPILYDYTTPYGGAGTLSITNSGTDAVNLTALSFTLNVKITGVPWGTLWPYGSSVQSQQNPDGTLLYSVSYKQPVSIGPGQELTETYQFSNAIAGQPVAMDPYQVTATVGGQSQAVTIKGMCQGSQCNNPTPGKNMIAYMANWDIYARKFFVKDMPINTINSIPYAFLNYDTQGNIKLFDPNSDQKLLPQLSMLRKRYPYLDTSISIGGWTLSADFSPMAANPTARANFVKQAVAAMKQFSMTGVDIDWEYPIMRQGAPGDGTHFAALLTDLRAALDQQARIDSETTNQQVHYKLSIAAPGGVDKLDAIQKDDPSAWGKIFAAVDEVNVMTYDFHGAFDQDSDFQSAMQTDPRSPYAKNYPASQYNVDGIMAAYKKLGADPKQLNLGVPIGYRAETVSSLGNTSGLYQPITGAYPGQFDDTGMFDYKCVIAGDCSGGKTLPADKQCLPAGSTDLTKLSQTPWVYSESASMVATGDDQDSAKIKAKYGMDQGLAGSMFWLASGDFNATDKRSIIGTTASAYNSKLNTSGVAASQFMLGMVLKKLLSNVSSHFNHSKPQPKAQAIIETHEDVTFDELQSRLQALESIINDKLPGLKMAYEHHLESMREMQSKGSMTISGRNELFADISYFLGEVEEDLHELRSQWHMNCLGSAKSSVTEISRHRPHIRNQLNCLVGGQGLFSTMGSLPEKVDSKPALRGAM